MPTFLEIDAFQNILEADDPIRRVGQAKRLYGDFEAGDLDDAEARAAISIFRAIVRDEDEDVRRDFARFLTPSETLPADIARKIASDPAWSVAAPFLRHGRALDVETAVDTVGEGTPWRQAAIAGRSDVGPPAAAAIAEVGVRVAVTILLANPAARITRASLCRIGERFAGDAEIEDALHGRADVPGELVEARIHKVSDRLRQFVDRSGWLSPESTARTLGNAVEHGLAEFTIGRQMDELVPIFAKWRSEKRITRGFVLRAACYGALPALGMALGSVAGLPQRRIYALWQDRGGYGRRSLVSRAGFSGTEAAFILAAVDGFERLAPDAGGALRLDVTRNLIEAFIAAETSSAAFVLLLERFAEDLGLPRSIDIGARQVAA